MLDYQRIVDDVRSSLFSNSPEGVDFLRSAAADYSVACDEVNERLRRCGALLKKGLRSEAVQLGEIDPNLLDTVATLDFPERQQWVELLAHYGVVAPLPLMLDAAADLNEAYALEQPLQELLRSHRLLALSHGPLNSRISTLRGLADADGNNPVWREDLHTFEKERQKQLQQDVANAAQAEDLSTLRTLEHELRNDRWLEMPPPSLVNWTSESRRKLEDKHARADLANIARQLNEAYTAFDVEAGRQWREHWNGCLAGCGSAAVGDLVALAQPALDWLTEQEQLAAGEAKHDDAVAKLQAALRSGAPAQELRRRRDLARAGGFALPHGLEEKVKSRLAQLAASAKRRKWIAIGASALALVVIIALSGFAVSAHLRGLEVARQADALGKLLDDGDLSGAQELVQRLSQEEPGVAASDELRQLNTRLQKAQKDEADRRAAFESTLKLAKAGGPEHPDYDTLNSAGDLAKTKAEKAAIQEFRDAISKANSAASDKRDADYITELAGFGARLKRLDDHPPADPHALQIAIGQFRADLKALEDRSGLVSAGVRLQAKPLWNRVEAIEAELSRGAAEETQLGELTKAIGDPDDYGRAITEFLQRFPTSTRRGDFNWVLKEESLWMGVEQWNRVLAAFERRDLFKLSPPQAAELLKAAKATLENFPGFPDAEAARRRIPYLEATSQRVDAEGKRITEPLEKLFHDPLVTKLWMLETDRGERYYFKDKPFVDPSTAHSANYVTGFDMAEKIKPGGIPPGATIVSAPQVALADAITPLLAQLTDDNWEETFYKMIQAIEDDTQVDPILKFNLLQQTLDIGCRGSHALDLAFAEHLQKLKQSTVSPFTNWLDPKDKEADGQRDLARRLFQSLPDVKLAGKAAADNMAALRKPFGTQFRWVGWLRRGAGGLWQCTPGGFGTEEGLLLVVVSKGVGQATYNPVGTVKQGLPEIKAADESLLLEGRPLYMISR